MVPRSADYQPWHRRGAGTIPTATARSTIRALVNVQGSAKAGEDTNHDGVIDTWDVMDIGGNLHHAPTTSTATAHSACSSTRRILAAVALMLTEHAEAW